MYKKVETSISKLTIEHLGLSAQSITLLDQVINFLSSLQDTLNSLVKRDFRLAQLVSMCPLWKATGQMSYLVQFLLDLHDAIRLLWILVSGQSRFRCEEGSIVFTWYLAR